MTITVLDSLTRRVRNPERRRPYWQKRCHRMMQVQGIMEFLLSSLHDTFRWGDLFGRYLRSGDVVALRGDLGAGKTTLVRAIAIGMGVGDDVTSPTYSLIQEYGGRLPMFHFDPYRLDDPFEMASLGLYEYLEREGVVVVEWADLILDLLPQDRFVIDIAIYGAGTGGPEEARSISLSVVGSRPRFVLEEFCARAEIQDLKAC